MVRSLLQATFESANASNPDDSIRSFSDLHRRIATLLSTTGDAYRAAEHLAFVIMNLAGFPQLNLTDRVDPNNAAYENAIRINEAVEEKQVLYFYLSACNDLYSLAEMARMVMFATL